MAWKHFYPLTVANNDTHVWCCGNSAPDQCDTGSHLAEAGSRSWRWVPGAASPDVGGGGCSVPFPASRRLLVAPQRHACSPRASAGQHCAPHTPCGSFAAAASQPHVLVEQKGTHWQSTQEGKGYSRLWHHYLFICEFLLILGQNWCLRDYSGMLERHRKMRDTFINTKRRWMFKTKHCRYSSCSPLLWLRNSSVKIGMSNTVRSFPSVSFCWWAEAQRKKEHQPNSANIQQNKAAFYVSGQ